MPDFSSLRSGLNAADPGDREPRRELADLFNEEHPASRDPRADVLRLSCRVHEQLGWLLRHPGDAPGDPGLPFPDRFDAFWTPSAGWDAAAEGLGALAAAPEDTPAFRARYERLVRGDVPLRPEHLEPALRLQYDLQVRLLASLDLLEGTEGDHFITALDNKRYPLPAYDDVLARVRTPPLRQKLRQGFDTLLLVPFGLPLSRLIGAWAAGLRRNAPAIRGAGAFREHDPLWVWGCYRTEPLVYEPRAFIRRHGGRTKEQFLAAEGRGWDVLLVEGALQNIPREGGGRAVGGRLQLECGRSPEEYLGELARRGETGLTPEAYVLHSLQTLERQGRVLDVGTHTHLVGAFPPASRDVPCAYWYAGGGQAFLIAGDPGFPDPDGGVRAAARVCS